MLKAAYEWYEEKQPGLGELLLKDVDACYDKLEKQPFLYASAKNNFRQILLGTFPYVIVFEIFEKRLWFMQFFIPAEILKASF